MSAVQPTAVYQESQVAGGPPASPPSLWHDRLWLIGAAALTLQGVGMLAWSTELWQRFALTWDYGVTYQAAWLIGHGHLLPFSTFLNTAYIRNHFELLVWLFALPVLAIPKLPVLLWIQDLCLVGAELVAWKWMCETARGNGHKPWIAVTGLLLLLLNPWAWWSISFDFHWEVIAVLFMMLAAYDLFHDRGRTWLWVALCLLATEVAASWVMGLGLAALLAGPKWRRRGGVLVAVGAAWIVMVAMLHYDFGGSLVSLYGYLAGATLGTSPSLTRLAAGVVTHPQAVLGALWQHRVDIWANVAPAGLIGLADPWVLGLVLPTLLADDLIQGNAFSKPLFQSVLLYVALPLGTALVLARLSQGRRRLTVGLAALVVLNAVAWSAVWAPEIPATWLRVSPAQANLLSRATAMIPARAEVVVSQGVVGRFSDRPFTYPLIAAGQAIPLHPGQVWLVLTPDVGIELVPSADQYALIQDLAGSLHADLVLHGHGVFVFRWNVPSGLPGIRVPNQVRSEAAWMFPGASGVAALNEPEPSWHLASAGRRGYVLARDYWREPPGSYIAAVTLRSSGSVIVEVWNDTGNLLLARRALVRTAGVVTVPIPVAASAYFPPSQFSGWGPFRASSTPVPGGDRLEIRIWSPGDVAVDVSTISLRRLT